MSNALERAIEQLAKQELLEWQEEDCLYLLNYVHERFYVNDPEPLLVEKRFETPIRGVLDMVLPKKEGICVRDWKVTKKTDDRWRLRQFRSKQFPLYGHIIQEQFGVLPSIEVVGLTVEEDDKSGKRKVSSAVLEFALDDAVVETARNELIQIKDQIGILPLDTPWPKLESGCRCFGDRYPCLFEKICWEQKNNSAFLLDKHPALSYSSINDYMRCPERLRLLKTAGMTDVTPENSLGIAFHACVAAMYGKEGNE